MPTLTRIAIYPLKSFDPILVREVRVLANGALEYDRRFAFVDSMGAFVNAKRTALIHPLQVHLDPVTRTLTAGRRTDDTLQQWNLDLQRSDIEHRFSRYFSMDVTLRESVTGGFPDDGEAAGPTIVSMASLQAVADWFPGLTVDQVRLRFRANLEVEGVEPFWEDRLFGSVANTARPFKIADVLLAGTNPCQRCVVPSRDPESGDVWPQFARQFSEYRAAKLPAWAPRERFDHFYRLTVNTRLIAPGSSRIQVGDNVELLAQ